MTDQNWNRNDYLFDFPDTYIPDTDLIDQPILGKVDTIRNYLVNGIFPQVNQCIQNNAELAGLILCLASIDYLAGFYEGRQTQRNCPAPRNLIQVQCYRSDQRRQVNAKKATLLN